MIKQAEIGGVPVLMAPTTGPLRAGLVFRVGFADEPLSRHGITHLVEHLALHSLGVADYHYNGATGVEYTHFHMQGSEPEIAAFLNGVCSSLRNLPMHRLATEKELLVAEANGRSAGVAEPMARRRHGARDYGISGYPEWGLAAISEDDLRAWVAGYFTRENAVLWVAGDAVPAGLRLDLPSGTRRPAPRPSSALPVTPAYFPGSPGVVVWDAMVPRTAAAGIFAAVLERMMFRELRQDAGLSYTVQTDLHPVGRDHAIVTAVADSVPEKQSAVLGAFVDVLATMRAGRIDPADVAAVVKTRAEALQHADGIAGRLPTQACNLLAGRAVEELEQTVAETRAVTPAHVAEIAAQAWNTGLMMAPTRPDWAGFAAAPATSGTTVAGHAFPALENAEEALVVAPDGVSVISADGVATVRHAECVLARAWPDGGRLLVGADGIALRIEPTLFVDGRRAVTAIDSGTRPEIRVDQPARDSQYVPQPQPQPQPAASPASVTAQDRMVGLLGLLLFWPMTVFFGGLAALFAVALLTDSEDRGFVAGLTLFCAVAMTGGVFGIRRSTRRRRGDRKSTGHGRTATATSRTR
jgi:zinc protease